MGFWVGVNSKNPSKSGLFDQKVGVYSRKTTKTGLFTLPLVYILANIFAFFKNLECNDSKQNLWTNSAEMHSHPLHCAALEIQLYDSM